jgi:D-beta-D-heptose 7-phosphate kinase / D-beta-D-heptose 1-phosphate adenosyltransferase
METLIDRCLQKRKVALLVVGDIMSDVYLWGKVDRISPEAPVPVFESTERSHVLGGAANVAANLRTLGCEVHLAGVVGVDDAGARVRELLRQQGIDDALLIEDPTRPTTEKTRVIAQQQNVLRLDQERRHPLSADLISRALVDVERLMTEIDGVVCSDYQKGVCTPDFLKPFFAMARSACHPIIVDPKGRDFSRYCGATLLTPNLAEVEQASDITLDDQAKLTRAAELLLQQSEAQGLLVTRGKDGMSLFHPPHAPLHIHAQAREVFDVTGAGDTVTAVFSFGVLCGLSFPEAAHLANTAAGIAVGKVGTAVVYPQELRESLREEWPSWRRKILRLGELAVTLQHRRQRGDRIVFTNGCFDLLHVGHIQYLQQARSLGDCLVVAMNDDASVRRFKGDRRPLISHDERARILAALGCVDYVTIFGEETPLTLIKHLRPNILTKGGDYTPETVVGRDEVEAYGGSVRILPYVDGVSTTELNHGFFERYGSASQSSRNDK